MPIIESKISRSFGILQQLKFRLLSSKDRFTVDAYQNGAEQGFTVFKMGIDKCAVTFCEHTHSQQIKVYLNSFAVTGISEIAYYTAQLFETEFDAIKYMVEHLTGN